MEPVCKQYSVNVRYLLMPDKKWANYCTPLNRNVCQTHTHCTREHVFVPSLLVTVISNDFRATSFITHSVITQNRCCCPSPLLFLPFPHLQPSLIFNYLDSNRPEAHRQFCFSLPLLSLLPKSFEPKFPYSEPPPTISTMYSLSRYTVCSLSLSPTDIPFLCSFISCSFPSSQLFF